MRSKRFDEIPAEDIIWQSGSITLFGAKLPWVNYSLTREGITVDSGFIKNTREFFLLYRIMDIAIDKNLFDRVHKTGTIRFTVNWQGERSIRLCHVRKADATYDLLCKMIKESKEIRTKKLLTEEKIDTSNP